MARLALPLLFGLVGTLVLASLGVWQLQRLAWKEAVLAEIEARIAAAPVPVPVSPDPEDDRYRPVAAEGSVGAEYVRVLVSQRGLGAGYRIISPFQIGERIVLLDRGILPVAEETPDAVEGALEVRGNLHWPNEIDGFTPEADLDANIWYARDVAALAAHLETEPLLIIAADVAGDDPAIRPLPVSTEGIPNNHLGYAIQWFGLAAVWLGMTVFFVSRITRRRNEQA